MVVIISMLERFMKSVYSSLDFQRTDEYNFYYYYNNDENYQLMIPELDVCQKLNQYFQDNCFSTDETNNSWKNSAIIYTHSKLSTQTFGIYRGYLYILIYTILNLIFSNLTIT